MQDITRRVVLSAGGLTAAAAVLPVSSSWAATNSSRPDFESSVGRTVVLRTATGTVRAVVRDVRDLISCPAGSPDGYSVLIKPRVSVPDGIYRVTGARIGGATLFFANVGRGRSSGLEAIVNTAQDILERQT